MMIYLGVKTVYDMTNPLNVFHDGEIQSAEEGCETAKIYGENKKFLER